MTIAVGERGKMAKYIDADKAIVEIEHHIRTGDELYPLSFGEKCINEGLGIATNIVDCMPPADVQEVRHGRWEHLGGDEWCCTACAHIITTEGSWEKPWQKYCEECGAKMDK